MSRAGAITAFHESLGYDGPTWEVSGWGSPELQRARFDAMLRTTNYGGGSVLDWGCGPADLFFHLSTRHHPFTYRGADTDERMVTLARHRGAPGIDLLPFGEPPAGPADYVFLSGVFQFPDPDDPLYYLSILEQAYDISGTAVAATFLSARRPDDHRAPDELYADPAVLARFAAVLTSRWTIDHAYHPDGADFTIALFR